jgi:hypothetical protein
MTERPREEPVDEERPGARRLRTLVMIRDVDVSQTSGTGTVAEGVEFSDGQVVLHWITAKPGSIEIWKSISDAEFIHGHGGATHFEFDADRRELER